MRADDDRLSIFDVGLEALQPVRARVRETRQIQRSASWSGSNDPTVYKSVARRCAPMASSPWILDRQTGTPDAEAMQEAPVAVHHRSACSGVKACPGEGRGRCETQA